MPIDTPPCQLVTLTTADGRRLHGALHEATGEVVAAVLHLHGKGGNFYSGPSRFLPEQLRAEPIRHLSLNLRSHDLAYTRDDSPYQDFESGSTAVDGGYWEDIETGSSDIAAGLEALLELGNVPLFLAGHSAGGFYAAAYAARDRRVSGQILLSPVIDNRRALPFWFPEPGELERACDTARKMIERGDGRSLIPLARWYYAISANTLVQRAAERDGTWADSVRRTDAATLLLWGELETRASQWSELFAQIPRTQNRHVSIAACGHDYAGREASVARAVSRFIFDVISGTGPTEYPDSLISERNENAEEST